MKKLMIKTALTVAAAIAGISGASAATVCFDPTSTCTAGTEQMVFLESATDVTTVLGDVGSQGGTPIVDFTSASALNAANGFANIKPNTGKSFGTLNITVPGYTFTDLDFSVQMYNSDLSPGFTIDVLNGATLLGTETLTGLQHDADLDFLVVSSTPITEIELFTDPETDAGFKEAKQFQISGLEPLDPTPLPAALPLFATGLGAMGLFGWRRKRKNAVTIAA